MHAGSSPTSPSVPNALNCTSRPTMRATHNAIAHAVDSVLPGARSHSIDELSVDLGPDDDPECILAQVKAVTRRGERAAMKVPTGQRRKG